MRKNKILLLALFTMSCISVVSLTGCKEKVEGPIEEALTPIGLENLVPGSFYVKAGDSFYALPYEDSNFDPTKPVSASDGTENGITTTKENRLLDYVYKDSAIPTLYKNDQLIYVSTGSVSSFTWERFKDYGYSIGISGLIIGKSGKISSGQNSAAAKGSSAAVAISTMDLSNGGVLTVDAINQTPLSSTYLNEGGIITGMSKDAPANIDFYIGTQHIPATGAADTRYFKSFEIYQTNKYTLSTDGYAILEVPTYLKSGFYFINNVGLVKFLNIDRGVDESGIDLSIPYYYTDESGKILTFYEWQEANGIATVDTPIDTKKENDINSYPDRMCLNLDATQDALNVTVTYRYTSDDYRSEANKNGYFPRAILLSPTGETYPFTEDKSQSFDKDNKEGDTYLTASVTGAPAGEWYVLFSNFENTYKKINTAVSSGNATTYLHNGQTGRIEIYYNASPNPHDFVVTWENKDRAASNVEINAPDGNVYSKTYTPGNIMDDNYGRYIIKVPSLVGGTYRFEITGDQLGRVWINCNESVALDTSPAANTPAETSEENMNQTIEESPTETQTP